VQLQVQRVAEGEEELTWKEGRRKRKKERRKRFKIRIQRNLSSTLGINPLNAELKPICHMLALLGAHPVLHVSRKRVNKTR
jgi:hypothetical protein